MELLLIKMQTLTLKNLIFSSTLIITLIIGIQLYLLGRMYSSEKKEFFTNVTKSVSGLFANRYLTKNSSNLNRTIIHPDEDTYLVSYNSIGNYDSVIRKISAEFVDYEVLASFNIGFYNRLADKYDKFTYIHSASSFSPVPQKQTRPVKVFLQSKYIYINFTNRRSFL